MDVDSLESAGEEEDSLDEIDEHDVDPQEDVFRSTQEASSENFSVEACGERQGAKRPTVGEIEQQKASPDAAVASFR